MSVIKVCGITRLQDAQHAVAHGATAVGFVLWPRSPRYVTAEQVRSIVACLPAGISTVGLFVDEPEDAIRRAIDTSGITTVQLNDDLPASAAARLDRPVFKTVTLATAASVAAEWPDDVTLLLDAHDPIRRGGTGMTVDWDRAAELAARRRIVLAGGLHSSNVADAILRVKPYGVDVASGVEVSPGVKDPEKVSAFLANARAAFEGHDRGNQ